MNILIYIPAAIALLALYLKGASMVGKRLKSQRSHDAIMRRLEC